MENNDKIGPYQIIKEIAQADLSRLYQVKHTDREDLEALKLFSDPLTEKNTFALTFRHDCPLLQKLKHPNIVSLSDFGSEQEKLYLVMKLVEGNTIKQIIQKSGPFSLDLAINILSDLATALTHASQEGILHLNIKSSNVFIDSGGKALLSDFGLSKGINLSSILDKSIPIHDTASSLSYFAPEQLYSTMGEVGPASDVYALGILLYEMLCGKPPFVDKVPILLAHMHISVSPEPMFYYRKDLPAWVQGLLDSMLAKDPLQRFPSASEFLSALQGSSNQHTPATEACEISLKGTIIHHRYRIDTLISKPRHSMLYLGFDLHTEQSISIEVPTGSSHFVKMQHQRELETLRQIDHPGFVKIIDIVDVNEFQYIIREYAQGQKLSQILQNEPMNVENSLLVMLSILDGINYLHQRGLLQREITSDMVTITPDFQVKITSFVLSKVGDASSLSSGSFQEDLEYTPPEKITQSIYDYRSEVYSLGILFFELLCGKAPFTSGIPVDIIHMHLNKKAVFPPKFKDSIPISLQEIVLKALEKDPEKRFQSVKEMHDMVQDYLLCPPK
ncbi:MAG TPA: serine/threonine-protein kinase [Caldisericia bacterium]|nr:serine/threonine-protein kinase [Caldisericia bacterium]